ncbi:nickel/cobalt transporter [Actinoplanes aureus]|uniref:Sulfite exporter TauE/SafE family protein n=1 Tax=Actinoplanes aureus TaxID=2792083 RepID=A0A931C5U4_9ACTN|nr:sulfite exporter TauE/SafE family protein [Actinoplanes aureus]MBG0563949.1 sulfite exporter TauE/SafE family protein [Actinoplanes aureus]
MRPRVLAWAGVAAAAIAGILTSVAPAAAAGPPIAHPLGRFTVNQYAGLRVAPDAVHVDYVVDLAELPAFQARSEQVDTDGDGAVSAAENARYAETTCTASAGLLRLTVADRAAPLAVDRSAVTFPAGEGGLDTLRLECTLRAGVTVSDSATVTFRNDAYADRVGWREITATGDRMALTSSDVPDESVSGRLGAYPEDPLAEPLDVRSATLVARPSADAVPAADTVLAAPRQAADRLTAAFTGVVERQRLTIGIGLLGIVLAMVLGAAHALAPGHGKTVMAAVLIGERGTWRQAAVIAGSVTVTHTAGVLVLGAALATSLTFAPQRLYGGLAAVSGVLLAVVGVGLMRRALYARKHNQGHSHGHGHGHGRHQHGHQQGHQHGRQQEHEHDHQQEHEHDHQQEHEHGHRQEHEHGHQQGHQHGRQQEQEHGHEQGQEHGHEHAHQHGHGHHGPVRLRSLLTLGFAGGLLPSPSAVVVLLGAVALGRPWYGVLLVVAYGAGMAGALISIGLALGRFGPAISRRLPQRFTRWRPALPVLTSGVIVLVGLSLTAQAVLTQAS